MSKIGRNSPCPCGSGKKYKKCCGILDETKVTGRSEPNYFDLNREIAYIGKIGNNRRAFCRRFNETKKKNIITLQEKQAKTAMKQNEVITCRKGCYYCCSAYVEVSLQECEGIVYYLYDNQNVLNRFLRRYPKWREDVRRTGDLYKEIGKYWNMEITEENRKTVRDAYNEENNRYSDLGIMCPFLEREVCSIYEVRPYMCVSLTSVSPEEHCRPGSSESPTTIRAFKEDLLSDLSFYYGNLQNPVVTFMPIAVYELLKGGTYYLSKAPGLKNIDKDFCSDPEVLSRLRRYGVI